MEARKVAVVVCGWLTFTVGYKAFASDDHVVAPAQLPPVVVTATRVEKSADDIPPTTSVATPEEIARRGASNPALLLREEPGVWVQQTGSSGGAPIVRGQIGNRVLYLWDGIRMNNGALFGGPNAFFNQIQPWSIERIEVVRGPGSVLYGSDAIGGVANILTQRVHGSEYPTQGVSYGGTTGARYASANNSALSSGHGWLSGPQFSLLGGGGYQDVNDYRGGGHSGTVRHTSYDTNGFFARGGWKPAEGQLLELGYQTFTRNNLQQYVQSKRNPGGIPTLFNPEEERSLVDLSYEAHDLAPLVSELKARSYLMQYEALSFRTTESSAQIDRRDTDTDQWMAGAGFQGVTPFTVGRPHKLLWGADYRHEDLRSDVEILRKPTNGSASSILRPQGNTPDGAYEVWDAFVQAELSIVEGLTISPGLRYEATHLSSDPSARDTVPPFTQDDLDLDKWWHSVTWSVGSVWWIVKQVGIAGSISSGFRAPNYSDALSFSVPTFSSTTVSIPSPGVDPEKAITYEIGPRLVTEWVSARATCYYTDLDDLIVPVDAGTIDVPGVGTRTARSNVNDGTGFVRGIEAGIEVRPIERITLFGSINYAQGRDTFLHAPLRFIPPLNGLLGALYEHPAPHSWWVEADARLVRRYTHHAPDDELDAGFAKDPGLGSPNTTTNRPLREDFELPGFAIVNLRAGVEVVKTQYASGHLTVALENFFDARYRETFSRQIVDPGRSLSVAFDLKF